MPENLYEDVIEVDEDNCYYDILGIFADGSVVDHTDVPLCALVESGSSYVFPDVPSHDEEEY